MSVLQDHQQRVAVLRDGLNRLLQLHRQVHDLHAESLALARNRPPDHESKIQALHDQARSLHREIATLRARLALDDQSPPR